MRSIAGLGLFLAWVAGCGASVHPVHDDPGVVVSAPHGYPVEVAFVSAPEQYELAVRVLGATDAPWSAVELDALGDFAAMREDVGASPLGPIPGPRWERLFDEMATLLGVLGETREVREELPASGAYVRGPLRLGWSQGTARTEAALFSEPSVPAAVPDAQLVRALGSPVAIVERSSGGAGRRTTLAEIPWRHDLALERHDDSIRLRRVASPAPLAPTTDGSGRIVTRRYADPALPGRRLDAVTLEPLDGLVCGGELAILLCASSAAALEELAAECRAHTRRFRRLAGGVVVPRVLPGYPVTLRLATADVRRSLARRVFAVGEAPWERVWVSAFGEVGGGEVREIRGRAIGTPPSARWETLVRETAAALGIEGELRSREGPIPGSGGYELGRLSVGWSPAERFEVRFSVRPPVPDGMPGDELRLRALGVRLPIEQLESVAQISPPCTPGPGDFCSQDEPRSESRRVTRDALSWNLWPALVARGEAIERRWFAWPHGPSLSAPFELSGAVSVRYTDPALRDVRLDAYTLEDASALQCQPYGDTLICGADPSDLARLREVLGGGQSFARDEAEVHGVETR